MSRAPFTAQPHRSGRYTLYAKPDYFKTLAQEIAATKPGQRVLVTAMTFKQTSEPFDALVVPILDALARAAKRGVRTYFSIDAHEFLIHGWMRPGPLWFAKTMPTRPPKAFADKLAQLEVLRRAGVHVGITNQPGKRFTNPFAGRSHIKAAVIDDLIFVGGCNLSDSRELDLMVSWRNRPGADWLFSQLQPMITSQDTRATFGSADLMHDAGAGATLLIDAGVRGQSLIYQRALEIIEQAERWLVITCQFFPNSETGLALKRAHARGVAVRPIFNHPSQHIAPYNLPQYVVTSRERLRMPREFFAGELPRSAPFLHAKLVANEQEVMIGSHNYVTAGVNFGTAEIALQVRQPAFAADAARFIASLTGLGHDARLAFLQEQG